MGITTSPRQVNWRGWTYKVWDVSDRPWPYAFLGYVTSHGDTPQCLAHRHPLPGPEGPSVVNANLRIRRDTPLAVEMRGLMEDGE